MYVLLYIYCIIFIFLNKIYYFCILIVLKVRCIQNPYMNSLSELSAFVKYNRGKLDLTQEEIAEMTGVGIHFIRDIEQNKASLRMDKVNQVLELFGYKLGPVISAMDPYKIWMSMRDKPVRILTKDRIRKEGFLMGEIRDEKGRIAAWKLLPLPWALAYRQKANEMLLIQIQQDEIENIELIEDEQNG
jgi:y4mF family transcriptional regulator